MKAKLGVRKSLVNRTGAMEVAIYLKTQCSRTLLEGEVWDNTRRGKKI